LVALRRASATGHEEWFPPIRLSAGYGFRTETIAGVRRKDEVAPIPDLPERRFDPFQTLEPAYGIEIPAMPSFPKTGLYLYRK